MTETLPSTWFERLAEKLITGAISGIIGGTVTFPLDTIKTRLQNSSRSQYNGFVDVCKKIVKKEGILGFYKGLPAVILGITPEKAIKLGVNDFMCEFFQNALGTNTLSLPYLVASGAIAGTSQVIVTNPMEIVKIRMQIQSLATRKGYGEVIRELGFLGLYTGFRATLLRDVPFSILYFSMYGWLRQKLMDERGNLSFFNAFSSGLVAGALASGAVTPADVIKTRLQSPTIPGKLPYIGIHSTAQRIISEEGLFALFRGAVPRMLVVSPLFAISLAFYEFQKAFLNTRSSSTHPPPCNDHQTKSE